jgi:hypothetical protein
MNHTTMKKETRSIFCRLRLCKMEKVYEGPGTIEFIDEDGKEKRIRSEVVRLQCPACKRDHVR